jgi:pimeloyl-ACP methyl ester carboxylesterase
MISSRISNTIEVCDKKIYYEIVHPEFRKPGIPVLIFLHEGLGSVKQWKNFPESTGMQLKCPALVYDRYGYGRSEGLAVSRTKDYLADEAFLFLPELLKKSEINEKIILIGHSDGGSIALLYASRFQDRVLGLVTEADHLFCENITIEGIQKIVNEFQHGKLKEALRKFHGAKTETMFYGWSDVWLAPENRDWNMEDCLTSITCPVLAIQGKNDDYGSEKQLLSKKNNISGPVEIMFIDNCGHVPHFQASIAVNAKIISFVNHCITLLN